MAVFQSFNQNEILSTKVASIDCKAESESSLLHKILEETTS